MRKLEIVVFPSDFVSTLKAWIINTSHIVHFKAETIILGLSFGHLWYRRLKKTMLEGLIERLEGFKKPARLSKHG